MWIGIGLILVSFVGRFASVVVLRVVCGTHWAELFDPLPGQVARTAGSTPLFPGMGPADFDDLVLARREILRRLPKHIARPMWWRVGLRNWSRAFFWIGLIAIASAVFTRR